MITTLFVPPSKGVSVTKRKKKSAAKKNAHWNRIKIEHATGSSVIHRCSNCNERCFMHPLPPSCPHCLGKIDGRKRYIYETDFSHRRRMGLIH